MTPLEKRGRQPARVQKTRANVQSCKSRGKRAVEGTNEGSHAIIPFSISDLPCIRIKIANELMIIPANTGLKRLVTGYREEV